MTSRMTSLVGVNTARLGMYRLEDISIFPGESWEGADLTVLRAHLFDVIRPRVVPTARERLVYALPNGYFALTEIPMAGNNLLFDEKISREIADVVAIGLDFWRGDKLFSLASIEADVVPHPMFGYDAMQVFLTGISG